MLQLTSSITNAVRRLLYDPKLFWALAAVVIIGDAILTQLIIRFVSYTEIDWETYMYQVQLYIKGERDYSNISGPTGPLVYPAGHVHIHELLYRITGAGLDIAFAQQIYAGLYIVSLVLSCAIYRTAGALPNWVILLLPLSKRLHSIFVLRLFNDCWAVVLTQMAVLSFAAGSYDLGAVIFSAAVSVKMSALLCLPGILVICVKRRGPLDTFRLVAIMTLVQGLICRQFLRDYPWPYFANAFDLSRVFLYKWTVNWRFLDEATFLSPGLARGLLLGHASVLIAFGLFKWCYKDGGFIAVLRKALTNPMKASGVSQITADDVVTIVFSANLIGIIFARSLHYQFYSWYAQQLPFLLWRTPYPTFVKLCILSAVEYAWNVYPSTVVSSGMLVTANVLALIGVWHGYPMDTPQSDSGVKTD
ncbi:glycosyltransferase family 58 protein [Heterobasidion irregulare TC 32-1]|uniref:Dol-P-Man:Man(5)GlcNAc(2)-PP-Dol alpha-1,3-mannosyltransferase n=1 Tax=Heterobasidion irregulare (strain TC 32-1) TaxID=747525 RepID=W4KLQ8_HETIT|nr:glycosyltransferase family 58 protein [Heterobasidion irregulare TC 32-1]ETW85991.1 glycosyltransferase family 58 protein [Heterobasidion irregulare TC 32-1]